MATAGTNYSSTVTNDASAGSVAWTNPTNAQGNQTAVYAAADMTNSGSVENTIKLIKGGTISGNNKSTGATIPSTLTTVSYGGTTDLWGLSFTVTDVNASNFGVVFLVENPVAGTVSNYLNAQNFGFSVPSSSTINGITCTITQQEAATSFVAGTQIQTQFGDKNIEDITVEDYVKSFNQKTKRCSFQKVLAITSRETEDLVIINEKIISTPEHLFLTDHGWIEAQKLSKKMFLLKNEKNKWKKEKVKTISFEKQKTKVYNFQVDKNETYFANTYAVHNVALVNRFVRVYNFGISIDYTPPGGGGAVQRRRVSAIIM
jgi:hypothetical protein